MIENKQELQKSSSQQRAAQLITLITFIVMLFISIVTIFFVPVEGKTAIDNFMMPAITLSAGYSYYLARKGNHVRGIYILLGMIATASIFYPFVGDNVGWETALGMLLITTSIANGTLPSKIARRISTLAFALAIIIILIEIFVPGLKQIPDSTSSYVIIIILAIVYLSLILFRFNQFTLQTKLIITLIALSVISVAATAFAINRLTSNELTTTTVEKLSQISKIAALTVSDELSSQINLVQVIALDTNIRKELRDALASTDFDKNNLLDEQWRNAVSSNDISNSLIRTVLNNEISSSLNNFQDNFPVHQEIFITDENGVNIASTNVTSDYYQADEEWWQKSFLNGSGAIFISQPIYDESAQINSIQIGIPIFDLDNKTIIGILRSTLNLDSLADELILRNSGETGRTEIYLPDGREIAVVIGENGENKLEIRKAPIDIVEALQKNQDFMDISYDGELLLAAQSRFSDLENETEGELGDFTTAVKSLDWRIVTLQNREDALQTVKNASRLSQLIGLAAVFIASLLAIGITQFLTRPIIRLTKVAEQIASGNLKARAEVESPDEIGGLATSFNGMTDQLSEILTTLEKRVAERTTDLEIARRQSENRASSLLAVGEISKFINSEQRQEILLPLITRLVSELLGFYHTAIFLIDETKQFAILQATNSEGGQAMLQRGFKLRIGDKGLVGDVAKDGTARVALDVGPDSVTFNSIDLPLIRSELVLPLKLHNQIIGVLDIQSEKPGEFTEDDVNTLGILADQISIAIENARLFTQIQQSLTEVQTLYRQNLQEGWKTFSREEGMLGYVQSLGKGKKLTETIGSLDIQQALNRGETMVNQPNGNTLQPSIVVPIKLRGQVIGVIRIQAPEKDKLWTTNEVNLSEAVSERLSLALENARLIQESQRQAIKEQTISDITGKIGTSINLASVLQTAVEELGRSIPGSEVLIKLREENVNEGAI